MDLKTDCRTKGYYEDRNTCTKILCHWAVPSTFRDKDMNPDGPLNPKLNQVIVTGECSLSSCSPTIHCDDAVVTNIELLGKAPVERFESSKIVGISANVACGVGAHEVCLNYQQCTEDTVSLSLSSGTEYNWGASVSFGIEFSAAPFGMGASSSLEISASVGGAYSTEETHEQSSSESRCTSAQSCGTYEAPGAAIIYGVIDEISIPTHSREAIVSSTCPKSGRTRVSTEKVVVVATKYPAVMFVNKALTLPSKDQCTYTFQRCIRSISRMKDQTFLSGSSADQEVGNKFNSCIG